MQDTLPMRKDLFELLHIDQTQDPFIRLRIFYKYL